MEIYNRLYEVCHQFDREGEHSIMLKCDADIQRECYLFNRSLNYVEIDEMKSILSMNGDQLANFNRLSNLIGIGYELNDITYDSVLGDYSCFNEEAKSFISDFLEQNLTADLVLDKINIKGIDSLSDADMKVLKALK